MRHGFDASPQQRCGGDATTTTWYNQAMRNPTLSQSKFSWQRHTLTEHAWPCQALLQHSELIPLWDLCDAQQSAGLCM